MGAKHKVGVTDFPLKCV